MNLRVDTSIAPYRGDVKNPKNIAITMSVHMLQDIDVMRLTRCGNVIGGLSFS